MAPWIDFEKIKREADFAMVLRHYGFEFPEGRTQLKLRCPFHEDGTPSLSVNLESKVWNCFGCGEHGSMLDFVVSIEMLRGKRPSARQAALVVAQLCGLTDYETERPVKGRARRPETTVGAGSGPETTGTAVRCTNAAPCGSYGLGGPCRGTGSGQPAAHLRAAARSGPSVPPTRARPRAGNRRGLRPRLLQPGHDEGPGVRADPQPARRAGGL